MQDLLDHAWSFPNHAARQRQREHLSLRATAGTRPRVRLLPL